MSLRRVPVRSGLLACLVSGFILTSMSVSAESMESIESRFIGDWELVSYVQFPETGSPIDMNYIGRLSYDALGNMSGVGMPRDLPAEAAQSGERIMRGFAYWGTVSYDLEEGTVIHHVVGSPMVPQWVGGQNVRYFEFDEGLLKLSLRNAEGRVTGTLTWRRLN